MADSLIAKVQRRWRDQWEPIVGARWRLLRSFYREHACPIATGTLLLVLVRIGEGHWAHYELQTYVDPRQGHRQQPMPDPRTHYFCSREAAVALFEQIRANPEAYLLEEQL